MLVKNYRGGEKWLNGVIREVLGPVTYNVEMDGNCVKRHVNQMLGVKGNPKHLTQMNCSDGARLDLDEFNADTDMSEHSEPQVVEEQPLEPPPPVVERSTRLVRDRRPPDRLNL